MGKVSGPSQFGYCKSIFLGNISRVCLVRQPQPGVKHTARQEHSRIAFAEQQSLSPWLLTFEMSGTSFRKQQLGLKSF